MLYLNLLRLQYFSFCWLHPLLISHCGIIIILVSLFNVHLLYVSVGTVSDGLDHGLDLPVQFLAVFAPEVSLRRVYDEFHVLAARLKDWMIGKNTQLLFLQGVIHRLWTQRWQRRQSSQVIELLFLVTNFFRSFCLLFFQYLLEIYCCLRSNWLAEIDVVWIINFRWLILSKARIMNRCCQWSQLFFLLRSHWIWSSFNINSQVFKWGFFVRTYIFYFFERLEQTSVSSPFMHRQTGWLLLILFHDSPRSLMDCYWFITQSIWGSKYRLY